METGGRVGAALAKTAVFLQIFKDMPDPRQPGKVRDPLDEIRRERGSRLAQAASHGAASAGRLASSRRGLRVRSPGPHPHPARALFRFP